MPAPNPIAMSIAATSARRREAFDQTSGASRSAAYAPIVYSEYTHVCGYPARYGIAIAVASTSDHPSVLRSAMRSTASSASGNQAAAEAAATNQDASSRRN